MIKKKETYQSWFFINQNEEQRLFKTDEQAAADTFVSFLSDRDYGDGVRLFRFDIYVEPSINLGRHRDSIYTRSAHLTAHVDYLAFI
ncbi:MAG: hypothetical protein ABW007_14940, partial [Chitinophagaceae bacterium]